MEAGSPTTAAPAGRSRRARRASGDERERAILETLEKLLQSERFHEISIDDLASGAGISRSSFYFYFPSKEAVLLTLLDRLMVEADAVSDDARVHLVDDPAEGLRVAISAYFTIFQAHRPVMLAGAEAQASNPEVRKLWNNVRERWVKMAAQAIDDERDRGGAPDGPPARDLAIALISMNEGVLHGTFIGEQPSIASDAVIETLRAVWLGAIYQGQLNQP
ncbi:MAG: TetR/AcrR family transcriptional regulator [Solirubrobacterales bacterium]